MQKNFTLFSCSFGVWPIFGSFVGIFFETRKLPLICPYGCYFDGFVSCAWLNGPNIATAGNGSDKGLLRPASHAKFRTRHFLLQVDCTRYKLGWTVYEASWTEGNTIWTAALVEQVGHEVVGMRRASLSALVWKKRRRDRKDRDDESGNMEDMQDMVSDVRVAWWLDSRSWLEV